MLMGQGHNMHMPTTKHSFKLHGSGTISPGMVWRVLWYDIWSRHMLARQCSIRLARQRKLNTLRYLSIVSEVNTWKMEWRIGDRIYGMEYVEWNMGNEYVEWNLRNGVWRMGYGNGI